VAAILDKAAQPCWAIAVHYAVSTDETGHGAKAALRGRAHAVASAFAVYAGRNHLDRHRLRRPATTLAARRLGRGSLVSVAELAALAHLPTDVTVAALARAGAKAAAPPPAVAQLTGPTAFAHPTTTMPPGTGHPAGIGHVTAHQLRHTLATQPLNRGMSLDAIAALLGHKDMNMTRVYARIADRTVADQYFSVTQKVEALYDQPRALPAGAEGSEMGRLRRQMDRRMLGNGYCARPVDMDCHFESVRVLLVLRHHRRVPPHPLPPA